MRGSLPTKVVGLPGSSRPLAVCEAWIRYLSWEADARDVGRIATGASRLDQLELTGLQVLVEDCVKGFAASHRCALRVPERWALCHG